MAPRRKSRPSAKGDCYEAAGKYMMDQCLIKGDSCGITLVHGEVAGQGPAAGLTFGHAWVLDGETVIDQSNGRNIRMPRMLYYALGGIEHMGNIHEYDWGKARVNILKFKHWGPWDLKTRSGL